MKRANALEENNLEEEEEDPVPHFPSTWVWFAQFQRAEQMLCKVAMQQFWGQN